MKLLAISLTVLLLTAVLSVVLAPPEIMGGWRSALVGLASVVGILLYLWSLLQAVSESARIWKVLPYLIALAPPFVHGYNYGLGGMTFLATAIFLTLTWLLVYLVGKELGVEQGGST